MCMRKMNVRGKRKTVFDLHDFILCNVFLEHSCYTDRRITVLRNGNRKVREVENHLAQRKDGRLQGHGSVRQCGFFLESNTLRCRGLIDQISYFSLD